MLTSAEIEAALLIGHERRDFEIKGPGRSDDREFLANVARAVLGLGNIRDGGHVVVGIDGHRQSEMLPGLGADELATWLAFDELSRQLAAYSDPPVQFEVAGVTLSSTATVAVIEVHEFADVPHLCAREYQAPGARRKILHKGALYVRPRKVPETSEVASSVEMREILDLATQKALRAYVATAERAEVKLTAEIATAETDDDKYDAERAAAWQ